MIRFNRRIQVQLTKIGQWRLTTDRADDYELLMLTKNQNQTLITDWWNMQHQSELRHWQKDIFVQELTRMGSGDDFILFVAYKKGQGYNQAHDICLMYHIKHKIWILSTQEYHWFTPSEFIDCDFLKQEALELDILTRSHRDQIYLLIESINKITYAG